MGKPVVFVELGAVPRWVQQSREARGLDPRTGRRPGAGPSPLAAVVAALLLLGGAAVLVWFVIALVSTLLS